MFPIVEEEKTKNTPQKDQDLALQIRLGVM
jgi:hypothetical protein